MASSRRKSEIQRQCRERETSPERTKVWTEPTKPRSTVPSPLPEKKVPVVYYLSRNGNLEHPHFMEVSLSSSDGLYLKDVMNRLNFLRGKGMASTYAWSSKRSYKNGFVWHDLSEDDFIHPVQGHEYVLKGSELLIDPSSAVSSSSSERPPPPPPPAEVVPRSGSNSSGGYDPDFPLPRRKKQPSWSSIDLNEYKVYKPEPTESAAAAVFAVAADASTQTDDKKQQRRRAAAAARSPPQELCRDEISPPPSSSSPETLESLIKADGRLLVSTLNEEDRTVNNHPSGRVRASAVLMHLISCGSISVKDHGFPLVSQYRARIPRGSVGGGRPSDQAVKDLDALMEGNPVCPLENKEYFSGSLIETKKKGSDGVGDFPSLKRSSSYNADRTSKMELAEKEIDGVRAKCIPRKPKSTVRKEGSGVSRSTHVSKRITDEPPK
ncbi:hypothetical protein QJS04_geneDACA011201 [Acorus gramineus]|uniref:SOSEKI DIX-like domain-containing protein n=1 Tax=Acorus gramineus TaxID=55184 RepID=A0AAV9AM42_ACOGR|nr:hypothetical protein QJS04_geneDACA011201 [Acorus gramineus]